MTGAVEARGGVRRLRELTKAKDAELVAVKTQRGKICRVTIDHCIGKKTQTIGRLGR